MTDDIQDGGADTFSSHSCETCRWSGARPLPMQARERGAVLSALKPGQRVPSGRCPRCGGLTVPGPLAELDLIANPDGGEGIPAGSPEGTPWDLRVDRLGEALILHLQHPDGHGFECVVEVHGDKPTLSLVPWTDPLGLEEAEPLASLKVGADHVALRSARDDLASAVVCDGDGMHATLPLSRTQWANLIRWSRERATTRAALESHHS